MFVPPVARERIFKICIFAKLFVLFFQTRRRQLIPSWLCHKLPLIPFSVVYWFDQATSTLLGRYNRLCAKFEFLPGHDHDVVCAVVSCLAVRVQKNSRSLINEAEKLFFVRFRHQQSCLVHKWSQSGYFFILPRTQTRLKETPAFCSNWVKLRVQTSSSGHLTHEK